MPMKLQIAFIKLKENIRTWRSPSARSPFYEYEDELPDGSALHVVEVDEEEAEPDPGGDVALQHDDTEEDPPEHGAELGAAE